MINTNAVKTFSTTQLIDAPLIRHLIKRHEDQIVTDYSDGIWKLMGSIGHEIIQRHGDGKYTEMMVVVDFDGYTVKGQLDFIQSGKTIVDYKVTSCFAVDKGLKDEWVNQLNVYLHLLRRHVSSLRAGSSSLLTVEDFQLMKVADEISGLRIVAILRDWGRRHADTIPCPVVVFDVPVWSYDYAESYIRERIALHKAAENGETPPVCTDAERWMVPPIFAVMKGKNKRSLRNLGSRAEAEGWMEDHEGKGGTHIEERPGEYRRCENYCDVNKFCPYWKA